MTSPLRVAFIGWGAINREVVKALNGRRASVSVVAVAVQNPALARSDIPAGAAILSRPDELHGLSPDLVVEAAGREAVKEWGDAALRCARVFVPASVGAFSEDDLLAGLVRTAEACRSRIVIPPGAVGIDALAAASILPLDRVTHTIIKPPAAWRETAADQCLDLDALDRPTTFFSGGAREAARRFPQNANVAVTCALAGVGLDRTTVALVADPGATANGHRISAEGAFGRLELTFENRPSAANPRSSQLAALSLVRLIEGQCAALVV